MASALPGTSSRPPKPVVQLLVGSDLAFWLVKRYLPALLDSMVVAKSMSLTSEQWATVRQTQAEMLPARVRRRGVLFDIYISNPAVHAFRLEDIQVPALFINAKDDPLSAFDNAARAAQRIPAATFVAATTGGHLLLGSEQRVREQVAALRTAPPGRSPGS